jgi:plasmid stabilization system protein ParE
MSVLTVPAVQRLDDEAATRSIREIAAYLQEAVGQRVAAAIAGLADAKQIGRYAREDGPEPHGTTERRLREGYKVVRMLVDAYDSKTARAWLFGTNTRLDDRAPIEVLGEATETSAFTSVVRAARQVASFQA